MNYTAMQWAQIALANAFGMDKLTLDERLEWARANDRYLDPADAEEPAAAYAIKSLLEGNDRVRIHLDATASGTQVLAALANCRKSGAHCNLFGEGREDAYTHIWKAMGELPGVSRKMAKQAFMTYQFGSKAVPREMLGDANLPAFYDAFQREFPGVWNVLRYMENLWQADRTSHRWTMPDGFEVIQWNEGVEDETVTLFGREVTVKKQVKVTKRRGISLMANITHSCDALICREMVKRAQASPEVAEHLLELGFPEHGQNGDPAKLLRLYRKTGFLSVDLLMALDCYTYQSLAPAEKFEVTCLLEHLAGKDAFNLVPVHDSFSCEASYCNDMCDMYRYLMQQLWDSTLLESIAEDITGKREEHRKYPDVLDGVHMIC